MGSQGVSSRRPAALARRPRVRGTRGSDPRVVGSADSSPERIDGEGGVSLCASDPRSRALTRCSAVKQPETTRNTGVLRRERRFMTRLQRTANTPSSSNGKAVSTFSPYAGSPCPEPEPFGMMDMGANQEGSGCVNRVREDRVECEHQTAQWHAHMPRS